jgi:hypothetical protein
MAKTKKPAKNSAKNKKPAASKAKAVKKAKPAKKAVKKPEPKKKAAAKPVKKAAVKPVAKKAAPQVKKPAAKPVVAKTPAKAAAIKTVKPMVPAKPIAKPAPSAPMLKANAKNAKDIKIAPAKAIALPKLTTKSVRKYQPDFVKSILDQPKIDLGAPIVRYSDAELMEFRELINKKLEDAKKELNYLQGLITRKDEMGGDETENRYMTMEDGSLSMEREQLSQMASRQITFIDHLEKALMRIENQTYGICRVTGKLIDKARLRAVPHATLSIEAKMGMSK